MAETELGPTELNKQERSAKMIIGKENGGTTGRYLVSLIVLLIAASLLACVAVVPIVYYSTQEGGVVVTAQIDRDANEVWEATVRTGKKLPHARIVERDDEKFFAKGEEVGTGNIAGIKVTSIGEGRSQVIVRAKTAEGEEEAERSFAIRVVEDICNELGVEFKLVEG